MKNSKRILTFVLLLVTLVVSASLLSSCSHVCEFGEVVSSEFLVSDATCTEAAVYYKSCECGEKSLETFTYGSPLGHSLIYHAAVEPTETANGYYEYWTCATCEKHFYDAEAQHPVADEETLKIPPVHQGHVHVFNQTATLPPMLVTAATCDAPAVYYHSCSCGVKGDTTFTSGTALGHDYVENAAEKFLCTAADCTNGATYYKSCSRCEAKSTETFTASAGNGHTYSETATAENLNSQATCTAAATYFKSCSVCGTKSTETFSYGVALGHNHVENTAEVNLKSEATCVDAAVYYKSCSVCGEKSTETFTSGRSLGHNNVENTDAKYFNADATCTSAATYYKSCSRCGTASSTLFTVGEPLPHTSTYTAEVLANCATSTDGVRAHYGCSECRKYFQDEACTIEVTYASLIVEATHKYAETVHADYIKSEATCAAVATYYKSCSVCGDKSSETFTAGEKASHSWSNVTTVVATCQNEGYTLQKCGTCQGEQKIDVVAKTSCTETYSVLTAATCSAEGVGAYTCSVCDTQRTVTIAKSSHTIVDTVTPATCTTAGYTTHTCSVCNESTTDTEVAALGHTTVSATCTVGAYCSVCDETLGAALGHSWQQSAEVLATCTAGGYTDYECQHEGCDETRRDEVGKNGHSYETLSEEQVAVDGKTCTYQTLTVKKCTVCDHTENDYGEETELHSYSSYITIEATCTEEGTKQHKCTACGHIETNEVGEVVTESYSAPEAHTWGEGQTVLSTQTTTTVYTCNGCGKTRIETTETSATVPSDALDTEIALKDASLSLDAATQEQLGGSDVNLSVDTVDQNTVDSMANSLTEEEKALLDGKTVYNFEMSVGDEPVTNFNGKITIKIPYSLDTDGDGIDDEDPDDIVVWYLVATYDDGGNITGNELALVEAEYIVIDGEGYAVFETDHFSYYTVTKLTPAQRCERFGHNWLVTEVPVTCLSNGYTLHLCLRCGAKDITDVVETEGHNFVLDEATRIIADCEHAGYEKHTCSNCQTFYEEKPEALGHDWNEVVTEATCTTAGYTTKTCNECGKVIVTDHVDPLGHNDEERVKDPTCLEEGYTDHWCDRCNKVFKRDGHREKTGHRWNVDAPDCEHDKFCRDCKNFDEDADNKGRAHGHHYDGGKCKDCDKACRHEHKKHSHDKAPTCGEDGHEVYICEDCCEFVEGNKIGNRPDHNYVYVKTIAATCTSPEYTVEKCSVCNQEKKTESGEMTEHNYSAGICTYCGKSANLFYLTLIESLFEAKGFSITVENLTYKYEKSAGTSLWILEGSLTQIDIASLMLYVDDNGELRGAASVSLIITNGPVDGDTTLNVEALIEDGYVYVDVTSDYDEMNLSMRYSTEKLIDLLLYEMTRMELEDLEAMVGMFETEFLPLIELLIATNEADIENVLSCLVDMIFSYENVGGKYVYVLDYEKLHALNENLSDLTVSEVIDLYFGEGSYEALCETVIEIFNLKISEIPAYVEELGIPEEDLIAAINLVCSMMGAPEDFDIADVFASEDAQTSTVGMMVFETEDYEDILAEVIEGLKSMNIYAMMGVGESNVETLTTMIDAMLDFYEDYISYTFIADANGKLLESGLSINSMVVGGGSNSQFSMGFDLSFVLDGMIDVDWEGIKDKIDSNADSVPALDDKVSFNNEYVGGGETTVEYNGSTYNAYYNIQNLNKRSYILSALNGVQYAPHCGDYIAYLGICDYVRECFETKLIYIREIEVYLMIHDDVTVEFTMDESTHTVAYTRADGTTGTFVLDPKSEGFTEEQYIMLFGEISYELDYKGTSSVSFAYNPVTGDITYDSVHNYVLKETKDPEGCGTDGYELYECENCGDTVYEYYNNNEHGYVVDKENSSIPTECGENGYYVYKCEECGDSYTAYVYKAHNYDYVYSLSEDSASCEDGFDCKYICTDCGEEILSVENAGAGHVYQSSYSYANGVVRSEIKCAICGNPESSYEYCYVDSELSVEISEASGGSYIYLAITPDATGVYELYGKLPMNSYSDSYAYLYDSSFIMLDSDDDSASNGQFGISYKLVAGQTYYLAVRNCHNATICIKLYDDSNDSVISLEEYGCTCGGKLYVKHIFGTVKVEAEHSESESCPIEYHGTSYGYNVDENCNRIRVVYAYIYNKNSDVSSSVEIASYKTGEKAHKQTTNTSNSEWGTMTDKDGNTVDYQKQYRIESCVACGKQIYKYEYLSCYDENGNLIIVEDLSYSYSSNTDELYLNRLHRDEYIRITNSGGDTESKLSLRLEEYYDVEGNVTRWTKIEFVYSGCYVTEKKTDSYGNESIFSDYDHSMSEKYVEEESGTASGTDEYGNVVTIVTDTIEHYCTDCMTSLSKTVYVSTYNTEEMLLKTETLYYDSYANSDTDYGYRLERKVETAYLYYEYEAGLYRQLVLCRKYSYYSETDSVNPEFWKSETYSYSSCCEYVVIYEDSDGYRSEDSGAEHSTHTEYRLSADSLTCEDGLDYYQVCSFCDYENLIREDEYYYHHVNRCDCLATKVDASEYGSECGGYIYIYSCPCGYRNEIENYDLECTLDEDSWHSYDDVDGKRDYYVYHYGCAVTDTYEGRNPCGFAYTIESWTEPNENCMGIRYVRYTFGIYSENPLVIEKSVETGSYYHVTESVSHDGEYYTEDGYDVYVRGHDLICVNCQKKTEEYECIEYVNSEGIVEKYEDNYIYYYADEIRYVTYRYERFEEEVLGRAFGNYQTYYGSVYYGLDGSFQSANDAYWTRDFVYSTEGTDARVVIVEQKNCEYYSLESYESKTPDWWNKYEYDYSGCVCDPVRICTTSDGYYEEDEDYNEYHYSYRYYYVTEPTCTQEGVRAEACNWCDYVNTWTVSPKGHSYDYSSDTQSYHCSRCELENFTGYDGPIVLEDLTWKLGNGEDYVIGYYVTGDYSYSIAVWLMTGDLDEDGFEIYLDITNFVEITDDGSMAYINIESIKAAIETMASSWDADYSICSDMVRISFVPDYSDVDVDCAITLDPHVLSYATDAAAEEGARPTTHSASCVFCNTVVKENETCNYYRSYYDSYTEDDVTYNVVSYTCRHCGNWYTETSWNALTDADTCEYTSYTKIEWADGSDTSSYSYTSHNWQNTFTGTVSSDEFTTTHNHGICADCGYAEEGETSCYFYTREAYDYIENGIEKHVEYKYCGYCGFTYKYVSYAILTDSSSCLYTEYITIYWDADGDGAYDAVTFTDQCPWYMHDCTSFSYISSDSDYFSAQHTAYCDCGYSSTEWCDFENTKKMLIVDGVMHTYNNYVCTDCGFEYTEDVYTEYSDDCTYTTYYVYSWTENGENKTYTEIGEGSHKSVYTFTEEEDGSVVRYNTCPCGEYCYSENTTTVTMNSAFDVELVTANTSRYFVYEVTVDVSGFYTFYSLSDGWDYETIGYIYDADGNLLYAQQNVFNENFRIRLSLEAGETYYLVTDFRQGYTGYWNGGSYTVYFTDKVR